MRKTIAVALVTFVLGMGASFLVLANPFQWEWIHHLGHALMDRTGASDEVNLVPAEGRGVRVTSVETEGERKAKYWRAPMDPTFISDQPGKSPMGMDLVPVYEDEEDAVDSGAIRIDPTFVQNIGVQSETVGRTDIPFTIRTVGSFTYDDSQIAWVNTKYEGWIETVYVNYVGEPVEKGQKLFEIYSPQLVTTQKEYLQALDYAERMASSSYPEIAKRAQSLVAAARERLSNWDVSEDQIEALGSTRELRRTLAVVSPVKGVVVEKMDQALEGTFVRTGMNLYKLVNLSMIWLEANVYENQLPWLRVGTTARITLPYEPGLVYTGRIRYLFPFFEEKTRTLKVSVSVPNPNGKLRADMYANVTFDVPSARDVIAAPEEAVIMSGQRNVVVLDLGNGIFQAREVTLGANGGGLWEVKEGLRDGDRVVVSAQFLIDSESNLREAFRKITSSKAEGAKGSNETATEMPDPMR